MESKTQMSLPLLCRAAREGCYGNDWQMSHGRIADALFIYLDGTPEPASLAMLESRFGGRQWVCLTKAWEDCVNARYPDARTYTRYQMKPSKQFHLQELTLPAGCQVVRMDKDIFECKPFAHGKNFASFERFEAEGAGAAAWMDGKIVASASSFISMKGEVEMDIFTEEAYRGMGIASACIDRMLRDCMDKGLTVQWDAQNEHSRHLAGKFGFTEETAYRVYQVPWVIATKRLYLRKMTEDDFSALFAVLADREIMQHYPYIFDETRVRDWISRNQQRYLRDGFGLWAVCLRETGEMIGDCGLTMQNIDGMMLPEIGYHIRRDCQHRGYAREAASAVMDWAFLTQDVDALYSYCKYTNVPSYRTAESVGMRFIKTYPDEVNEMTHVSGITRDEWAAMRQSCHD